MEIQVKSRDASGQAGYGTARVSLLGSRKLHDPGRTIMGTYCERGNCSRQFEAPRSSTAGIDKENPAPFFDYRPMGMAGDDSRESRGMRIEVELRQVMKNVDFLAANLDDVVCGKTARPSAYVVIAAHSSDGRNASERVQNRWVADVAAMNDEVRVAKRIKRFRPNQTVGI
jgi:hypothetical protein